MAEIATIARPYAEALLQAAVPAESVQALASVAADPELLALADNPKITADLVFQVIADVLERQQVALPGAARNFLRVIVDNGRLPILPEIARQYRSLLNARGGVSDAVIQSAWPIEPAQLVQIVPALERRFGRRLEVRVEIDRDLIGGIRVVVGDEVLDTSVKAGLEQMKAALTA
jgi:F-type H+-transporting ATPase subunit delta